jgi:tetratricopeptide (TPR) repeat protein
MAVRYCAAAVSLRPDSAPAHNNLGTALLYHDHGAKWDEAIGEYRKAIEIDPKHDRAYGNLGALWCDFARDYDKAIECFLKAIDLDPNYADHHFNLGNALRDQLNLPAAVVAYRKAIELNPRHVRVRQNLALVLATGPDPKVRDPRLAVEHAKKMVELEQQSKKPDLEQRSSMALQVLGWALYRAGAWRESIAALEESCKLQKGGTGDAFQWIALALAHAKLSEEEGLPEKERAHHKAEARRQYEQADRQIGGRWRDRPSEAFEHAAWDFHAEARELMKTESGKKPN